MSHKAIIDYYNYTLPLYRIFYHRKSYGIHYGFWDSDTRNHHDALINTNKFLAQTCKISENDKVLDAGCGVGGSAIWLAKNIGANVTGITLSDRQLEKAKQLAARNKVDVRTQFFINDYLNTQFQSETFSVVWAIESVCYSAEKKDFLKEAYRLLNKGGRLIIADGFQLRKPECEKEKKDYDYFIDGWALQNLANDIEFEEAIKDVGFKNIMKFDKVNESIPSSKKIYRLSRISYPLSWLTEKIGLTPKLLTKNNLAGITQYRIIKNGILGHKVFYAEK